MWYKSTMHPKYKPSPCVPPPKALHDAVLMGAHGARGWHEWHIPFREATRLQTWCAMRRQRSGITCTMFLMALALKATCPGGATPRFWTPTTPPQLTVGRRPLGGGGGGGGGGAWEGGFKEGRMGGV